MSVVEIARREMAKAGKTRLTGLEIEIGEQAGVERSTFLTAVDAVCRQLTDTPVRVTVIDCESRATCLQCGNVFHPRGWTARECPSCGSGQCLTTGGREFRLTAVSCE